jgi:hypothetical protein
MRNWLIASIAVFALVAWAGCQAPCDAMCDAKADYLEACIDATETALNEGLTPPEGWDLYDDPQKWWSDGYGVGGAEEYAESCKADADAVLAGDVDKALWEQECDDDARLFEQALDTDSVSCHLNP